MRPFKIICKIFGGHKSSAEKNMAKKWAMTVPGGENAGENFAWNLLFSEMMPCERCIFSDVGALGFVDLIAPPSTAAAVSVEYARMWVYICSCLSYWSKWTILINDIIIIYFVRLCGLFSLQFLLLCSHAYRIHVLFLYLSGLRVGVRAIAASLKYLACGHLKYLVKRRKCALGAAVNLVNFHLSVVFVAVAVIHYDFHSLTPSLTHSNCLRIQINRYEWKERGKNSILATE